MDSKSFLIDGFQLEQTAAPTTPPSVGAPPKSLQPIELDTFMSICRPAGANEAHDVQNSSEALHSTSSSRGAQGIILDHVTAAPAAPAAPLDAVIAPNAVSARGRPKRANAGVKFGRKLTDPVKYPRNGRRKTVHRKCAHGKRASRCIECGGSEICVHKRIRISCRLCRGASICKHDRQRNRCKDCGGSQICEHGRERNR